VVAVRSVQATAVHGESGTATRGAVSAGDLLIAFHSADSGGNDALELGGGWTEVVSHPGGVWPGSASFTWAGTKVWSKRASTSEPAGYSVSQGPVADGVVTIVAISGGRADNLVVVPSSLGSFTSTAPAATPAGPSGLQLRYAAGVPNPPGGSLSWLLAEEDVAELSDARSGDFTAAVVASGPIVSTSMLPSVDFLPTENVDARHAITVLVDADFVATPEQPQVPGYAPGRGSALWQYRFVRLLDRTYLGHLDLKNVNFDKRILQPGSFSASIPIPSRRVGDQVAEIIPRDETDLGIGPGVISCEVYRADECWGEYWITGAKPGRSGRGTPTVQLRGSTLEAYLAHVELQERLPFSGQDQITIARSLLSHLMAQAHANISLSLQPGVSGVMRDRTYEADEATYGQRLTELAQVDDGFEWMINLAVEDGVLQRQWVWGYPLLGTQSPAPHVIAETGGDILDWDEDIDALRGATRWRARSSYSGGGDASTGGTLLSSVHEATDHLDAGWPRLDRTINKSGISEQQTLEEWAAYWAATAPGALRVDSLTVALGAEPSFTPNSLGDSARIYLDNEWHPPHWRTRRIIGIGVTPTSKESGKEEAKLILEGRDVGAG
ncbi:hypothetical protein JYK22_21365, partial [Nonomuraea sp. RK-328]|nr:hypothetical protein [Nonomuraea sp. RK-328]